MLSISVGPRPPSDVPSWLTPLRGGSAEALGQLLQSCRRYLLSVAERRLVRGVQSKIAAADAVQETFVDVVRDFRGFHGSTKDEWLAWLRRPLRRNLANLTRRYLHTKKRRLGREIPLDEVPDSALEQAVEYFTAPEEALQASEDIEALDGALRRLPDHYRVVVVLHQWDNLSFAEIGRHVGRSEEAVRKLWVRAIAQLHILLESSSTCFRAGGSTSTRPSGSA